MKRIALIIFLMMALAVFFMGCKKEEDQTPDSTFNKQGMLSNIGENLILPAYDHLKSSVDSLVYYCDVFISSPDPENLSLLQVQFQIAYQNYQWISTFEFGPAETELIRARFNTFPCDTIQIGTKTVAGDFNLSTVADLDAQGFPAIDYLLYRKGHNNDLVLQSFTTDGAALNRKNYLSTLVNELKHSTDVVHNAWNSIGGNYINTFKNNTGNDVGSSIGFLVNQLNFDYELLKNAKVGIPLGKKSLGVPLPEKAEALYSSQSLTLLLEQLKSIEHIYLGKDKQGADGLGLDDYLVSVDAQHSLGSLNTVIKNKFISAREKVLAIPEPLSEAVISSAGIVDQAYAELQQLVVLLKVDMPSALGVLITYQDNDGD